MLKRLGGADHGCHRTAELVRDQRDEVRPERRKAAQLVGARPFRLVGPQVLDGGCDEPAEERHEVDFLGSERGALRPRDCESADRASAQLEGREDARADAEGAQVGFLRVPILGDVLPVDRPPLPHHLLQDGLRHADRAPGREDVVRAYTRGRHDATARRLHDEDRRTVEGEQAAQLLDEGGERRVQIERRAERTRRTARRLEQVDSPPELVAQPLRLGCALLGGSGLTPFHVHEPPDDAAERDRHEHAEHERVVPRGHTELCLPPELEPDEDRKCEHAGHQTAGEPEEQRGFEHHEIDQRPQWLPRLPGEDEHQRRDNRSIRDQIQTGEVPVPASPAVRESKQEQRDERLRRHDEPGSELVARGGEVVPVERHLRERQRHERETDVGEDPDQLHARLRRSMRASAHSACSRRRSSSPPAYRATASRSAGPPTFPAAISALRRSQRGSLRGT